MNQRIGAGGLCASMLLLVGACGTYSHIRPPDNLISGELEIAAGLAANGIGEVVPVGAAALGLTDWLELEGQYEVYSGFAELRASLLRSEVHGIALALGAGAGAASVYADDWKGSATALADLVVGRHWTYVDLYAGDRFFYMPSTGYSINSLRAGVRGDLGHFFVGAEGGATLHQGVLWLGEGALYVGARL